MPNCYSEPASEKRRFVRNKGECRDSQLLKGLRVSDERVLNKAFVALPVRLREHCRHGSGNYMRGGRLWRVAAKCYLPSMAKPLHSASWQLQLPAQDWIYEGSIRDL